MSCFDAAGSYSVLSGSLNSESPLNKTKELFFDTDQSNEAGKVNNLQLILDSHSLSTCFTRYGTKITQFEAC